MKIALLTLPLTNNYGGILQAWALKEVLEQLGNKVHLLNIQPLDTKKYRFSLPLKKFIAIVIGLLPNRKNYHYIDYRNLQTRNFRQFKEVNFKLSKELYSSQDLKNFFTRIILKQ